MTITDKIVIWSMSKSYRCVILAFVVVSAFCSDETGENRYTAEKQNIYVENAKKGEYTIQPRGEDIAKTVVTANVSGRESNYLYEDINSNSNTTQKQAYKTQGNSSVTELWVNIDRVQFVSATSSIIEVPSEAGFVDLLKIRDDVTAIFVNDMLPKGNFEQIRIILSEPNGWVNDNGTYKPLKVSSGLETGIKIVGPLEILTGFIHKITLDFNIEDLVYNQGIGYVLTPVVHISHVEVLPPFVPGLLIVRLTESIEVIESTEEYNYPLTNISSIDDLIVKHNVTHIEPVFSSMEDLD